MNHRSLQYILNCHTHHTPSRRMDGADRFYLCFHQDNAPSGLGASAGSIIYYHILWRSGHEAHRTSSYIMEIGARGSGAPGLAVRGLGAEIQTCVCMSIVYYHILWRSGIGDVSQFLKNRKYFAYSIRKGITYHREVSLPYRLSPCVPPSTHPSPFSPLSSPLSLSFPLFPSSRSLLPSSPFSPLLLTTSSGSQECDFLRRARPSTRVIHHNWRVQ